VAVFLVVLVVVVAAVVVAVLRAAVMLLRRAYLQVLIRSCEQDIEHHQQMQELAPQLEELARQRLAELRAADRLRAKEEERCASMSNFEALKKAKELDLLMPDGYWASHEPKCPHCGELCRISHNDWWRLYEEGEHEVTCPHCDGDFTVHTRVSYSFSTDKQG
jgi:hypothetical protein